MQSAYRWEEGRREKGERVNGLILTSSRAVPAIRRDFSLPAYCHCQPSNGANGERTGLTHADTDQLTVHVAISQGYVEQQHTAGWG